VTTDDAAPARPVRQPWHRLPARVGELLVAPGAALRRIEAEGGGLRDAIGLVVAGALAFRLPDLIQTLLAIAAGTAGAVMRLWGLFGAETLDAAWVVLPAAIVVTVAAGARRDAARDLELGAACYQAFFAVRGVARALDAIAGAQVMAPRLTWAVAALAAAPVLMQAVAIARARTPGEAASGAAEPATPTGRARVGALALAALLSVGLAGNAVWASRHIEALRPMRRGQEAPDFTLSRLDAPGDVSLSALRGQVVVLDFWATWCPPCLAMMPVLDQVHARWSSRGVAFVGVNSDGGGATVDDLREFLAKNRIPYPVVLDAGRVGALYKVESLPTLFIVGKDGRVRATFIGMQTQKRLDEALAAATAAP
jgi:cytochrome c biogenesis protein CcmG/thiol:disulfide interchange protein DsbE